MLTRHDFVEMWTKTGSFVGVQTKLRRDSREQSFGDGDGDGGLIEACGARPCAGMASGGSSLAFRLNLVVVVSLGNYFSSYFIKLSVPTEGHSLKV